MIDRTGNKHWQLQNALDTAMRNMIDVVYPSNWAGWIVYLLEQLDYYLSNNGYGSPDDTLLRALRDAINMRLETGAWDA